MSYGSGFHYIIFARGAESRTSKEVEAEGHSIVAGLMNPSLMMVLAFDASMKYITAKSELAHGLHTWTQ